ncbi:ATP-dependent DNA ligase [Salix suchowensis]|nr:ATP-dependent DNA ligase [Salix suchowensis]
MCWPRCCAKKQGLVERLLVSAKGEEVRYLVRTLSQNLRVGAVRTSIFIALARAMVLVKPSSALYSSEHCIDPTRLKRANIDKKNKKASTAKDTVNEAFKAAEGLIRRVYAQHPSYDDIINALLESGLEGLSAKVPLTVARSLSEVYKLLNGREFTAEYKYDGQRAQIHASKLVDDTVNYPDIIALVEVFFSTRPELRSFIMDSEVVAINPQNGSLKTFQDMEFTTLVIELSYRARKDVLIKDVEVQVGVFAFDLMFLDGEVGHVHDLGLHVNMRDRFCYPGPCGSGEHSFTLISLPVPLKSKVLRGSTTLPLARAIQGKKMLKNFGKRPSKAVVRVLDNEGQPDVSVPTRKKPLPATYEPDKRTTAWLKLKKDYVDGLGDSLDLIPIGAWHGNGRKAAWWSPILLGVWDTESGRVVAVCKCMSVLQSEAVICTATTYCRITRYRNSQSDTGYMNNHRYVRTVLPGRVIWVVCCLGRRFGALPLTKHISRIQARRILQTSGSVGDSRSRPSYDCASITISPTSVAALGLANPSRGLSLRFPRFIKVREDKSVMQASTPQFLADLWKKQDDRGFEDVDDGLIDVDPSDDVAESEEESDDCNSKGLR